MPEMSCLISLVSTFPLTLPPPLFSLKPQDMEFRLLSDPAPRDQFFFGLLLLLLSSVQLLYYETLLRPWYPVFTLSTRSFWIPYWPPKPLA